MLYTLINFKSGWDISRLWTKLMRVGKHSHESQLSSTVIPVWLRFTLISYFLTFHPWTLLSQEIRTGLYAGHPLKPQALISLMVWGTRGTLLGSSMRSQPCNKTSLFHFSRMCGEFWPWLHFASWNNFLNHYRDSVSVKWMTMYLPLCS